MVFFPVTICVFLISYCWVCLWLLVSSFLLVTLLFLENVVFAALSKGSMELSLNLKQLNFWIV